MQTRWDSDWQHFQQYISHNHATQEVFPTVIPRSPDCKNTAYQPNYTAQSKDRTLSIVYLKRLSTADPELHALNPLTKF